MRRLPLKLAAGAPLAWGDLHDAEEGAVEAGESGETAGVGDVDDLFVGGLEAAGGHEDAEFDEVEVRRFAEGFLEEAAKVGDAEVTLFGPEMDAGVAHVVFGHEIERGGDAAHGGLDAGGFRAGAKAAEALEADHEAGDESPHRGLVAARFLGELGDEFAQQGAEEGIALVGDEVAETRAGEAAGGEQAGLGADQPDEARGIEIDPGPAAAGAGDALREMDFGGGDDGDIARTKRENLATDDEGARALVAIAELEAIVAVEHGDGAVSLLEHGRDANGEIFRQRNGGVDDPVGARWSFLHSYCILMRRFIHLQP